MRRLSQKETEKKVLEIKREIVRVGKLMHEHTLVSGTGGTMASRVPNSKLFVITPSGFNKGRLSPEHLVVMNLKGEVVEGNYKPSIEIFAFLEIFNNLSRVKAIVHTHSSMAIAAGLLRIEVPPAIVKTVIEIGSKIPLARYACPGTKQLGKNLVEALKDSNAVLMERHGVLAVGQDLETALNKAIIVEELCTQYLTARLFGEVTNLSKEEMSEVYDVIKAWGELKKFRSIQDWEKTLSRYGRS
ncbi:MAG: class II aldolase/adducin family protein [Nitrososphaeria archaeon]